MTKKVWKTVFMITLILFVLLSLAIGIVAFIQTTQSHIIGSAGWPTFYFRLTQITGSPIGYIHAAAFLTAIVSLIGWRICKK